MTHSGTQRFVEFPGDLGTLRGVWHHPDSGAARVPAVMLLHGFTGSATEHQFLFVETARRLAAAGIAALRADFYGSGNSDGRFSEMTVETEVADARHMFAFMAAQTGVDTAQLGVLGYSLGGCVAGLFVGGTLGTEPHVQSLCLWAPVAHLRMATWIEAQAPPAHIGGLELNAGFAQSCRNANPVEALAGFDRPTLVLHGDQDSSVPLADGAQFADKVGGRLHVIEGADHNYNDPTWREAVIGATVQHFTETLYPTVR